MLKPMVKHRKLDGVAPLIADPSLFYDRKSYLKPFGRGGGIKLWEDKAD